MTLRFATTRMGRCLLALVLAVLTIPLIPASARAATPPSQDPFYTYSGSTPLADIAPGTILATRTGTVHLATLPTPIPMVQVLYRTVDALGRPSTTVASILKPLTSTGTPRLLSYQSFYDSLTNECEPSYVLNGGLDKPTSPIVTAEEPIMAQYLLQGYTIVTADFEGQTPAFATGTQYGRPTLDAIRAAIASPEVGLPSDIKVAMLGYSGGAIATEWAAEYAPTYAPDVNARLVGAAMGGVFVDPLHNLSYVNGSVLWSGVLPLALIGIARAYDIDFSPYQSAKGKQIMDSLQNSCIADALGHYPGLTFDDLVKPEYALGDFAKNGLPSNPVATIMATYSNKLTMGTAGTPTIPLFIREGTGGEQEGTLASSVYGPGDGVMVAGDVRTLARQYCAAGTPIDYAESPLSHTTTMAQMLPSAQTWIGDRFNATTPSSNCDSIQPGNSIAAVAIPDSTTSPSGLAADKNATPTTAVATTSNQALAIDSGLSSRNPDGVWTALAGALSLLTLTTLAYLRRMIRRNHG